MRKECCQPIRVAFDRHISRYSYFVFLQQNYCIRLLAAMATRLAARYVPRRLMSKGKVLGEEEKAAENVYIKVCCLSVHMLVYCNSAMCVLFYLCELVILPSYIEGQEVPWEYLFLVISHAEFVSFSMQ